MSTWPNRGVPPAAWQGPEDKKQQPKTNSPNRLTHRNTDSPSQREMRETEGEWIPFMFYYYGPAIAGGVSWLATSGWRTIPSVWHNSRQRFSRLF
jgi:hypothetical protein